MGWPSFVPLVLAFASGAVSASLWPASSNIGDFLLAGASAILFAIIGRLARPSWRCLLATTFAFICGVLLFVGAALTHQKLMLAPSCDGKSFPLTFQIDSLPSQSGQQWRFLARLSSAGLPACLSSKASGIKLSWWQRDGDAYQPQKGDLLTATVVLRRPHSSLNPGGFDYVAWLWRQQLHATGYIKSLTTVDASPKQGIRSQLEQTIKRLLPDHPAQPLVLALSMGIRDGISNGTWRAARETGLSHLLAISGLHLGLIAAAILWFTQRLSRQLPRERGWNIAWLMLPAMLAASFYAYMAGWPLSTQRAWIMLLVFWLAAGLNWRIPRFHAWAFALLVCLVLQPLNVLDGGFYLSFSAVAVLLWFVPSVAPRARRQRVWSAISLQAALLLALLPLQLSFFAGFSWIALPLNLLMIPPFALVILPALLLVCLGLMLNIAVAEQGLWLVAESLRVFQDLILAAQKLSEDRWFGWQLLGQPSWSLWALLCCSLLFLAMPKGLGLRLLAIPALLLSIGLNLAGNRTQVPEGGFILSSFDAGQSTAVLIQTQHTNILYDTAAAWRGGGSAMQTMLLPAMANMGVDQLDWVIISHDDNDHIGGLPALLTQYPEVSVIGNEPFPCKAGFSIQADGVTLQALSPSSGLNDHNDQSCVIRVSSPFGTALLTGDISKRAEKQLLASGAPLKADWLLVPHHGSRSSSSKPFIKAVLPNTAVITSGHNNRYGLPAAEVIRRYQQADSEIQLLNTAQQGAIRSEFSAKCQPCNSTQRDSQRWWQRSRHAN